MPLALLWRRQDEESPSDTPAPTDGTGETTTSPPDDEPTTPPPSEPTTTPTSTRTTSSTPTSTRTTTTSTRTSTTTTQPPAPPPTSSSTTTTTESVTTSLTTTSSDSLSSPTSAPAGPAFPSGNTKTVDPTNNFVDPNDVSSSLESIIAPVPTQSTVTSLGEQQSSSSSKALPIVLPCLLIPIALAAVLVMIIRRRRQQHSQMLDDFTHRSTFYGGPATGGNDNYSGKEIMMTESSSNIARSPSLASSRYHDAYGPNSPSGAGNMDHTMPPMVHNQNFLSAGNPGFATAAAPIRAHQHTRSGSDDLDIKCAGRIESSASFGALYDQYGSNGAPGQTQGAANGDATGSLAYDRSSVAAPMPDHPYASAQAPVYPTAYQHGYQQQVQQPQYDAYSQQYAQYAAYSQQQETQYQYQAYSQQQYPTQQYSTQQYQQYQQYQPQQYQQQYAAASTSPISPLSPPGPTAPLVAPAHSRTVTSSPPQLDLPAFSFDFNNVSNSASPISAVFQSDDPFADPGSAGAAAAAAKVPTAGDFPAPPTRVSMERRAARTKSVEQRLMMALDDTQRAAV